MNIDSTQHGFALVLALLYLSVVTLLVTAAFANSLLQSKMSQNWYNASLALQNAESALFAGEQSILGDEAQGQGKLTADAIYSYSRQSQTECEVLYQVNASGFYATAKSNLQSLFAVPNASADKCREGVSLRQRMYWLEML